MKGRRKGEVKEKTKGKKKKGKRRRLFKLQ